MDALVQNPFFWLTVFAVALLVLIKSSDFFIAAAEKIGIGLGISPFIVGVTIVAAGTSLPELMSSIVAVTSGKSEIVVGNVIGSNITNILLVLGLTAVVGKEIRLKGDIRHVDMPLLLFSAFLLMFMLRDAQFSIVESIISLIGVAVFLIYTFKSDQSEEVVESNALNKPEPKTYLFLLLGGVGIYFGAEWTVTGVVEMSDLWGVDRDLVALSLVAFGTSVPELIVSVMAARRGHPEIAVGNVLGSNIFNTYVVMGIPRLVGEVKIPADVNEFSLPLMLVATILFFVMTISQRMTRWEGLMLLVLYIFFYSELLAQAL